MPYHPYHSKGFGVTVETILMMGGIVAAAIFFASFYELAMNQAGSAYSASENGFSRELEKKIDMVYLSGGDYTEYGYSPRVKTYSLVANKGKISITMPGREPVYVVTPRRIADSKIENSEEICIKKQEDMIILSEGNCRNICDPDDDVCDEKCETYGIIDSKC